MYRAMNFLIVIHLCAPVYSQIETDIALKADYDTLYVKSYTDQLAIKLYGVTKSNEIRHVDDFTNRSINYKPNDKFNVGIGFNYKWLGLDLAFNLLSINNDDEQFGKTDRFDIQSNIYMRKFAVDFNLQFYQGYYVDNPNIYLPNWTSDLPNPQRSDIQTGTVGVNAFYIFKHDKFSYRATFIFNERQKKSAGSWIAGPYFSYFTFDADSSIVPQELLTTFNPDVDFRKTKFTEFGAAGGYAHTFVIGKKFFFSLTLAVGLGPEFRVSRDPENDQKRTDVALTGKITARSSLGFNSDKTFFGFTSVADTSGGGGEDQAWLQHSINNVRIFFGKRFDVSRWGKSK